MSQTRIIAIEDEADILELVTYNLRREGYEVEGAQSGEDGLRQIFARPPNLVVLDLMLPGVDGLEVCRRLRGDPRTAAVPVLIVSAKGEEADVVTGLTLGADDYVTKPFSPRILIARVRAVLRRRRETSGSRGGRVEVHELAIEPEKFAARLAGQPLALTKQEFELLHFLARHPGWVFTRYQIVDGIKGEHYVVTERAVDVQIVGLRKKLGNHAGYIETVRGVGYRFRE